MGVACASDVNHPADDTAYKNGRIFSPAGMMCYFFSRPKRLNDAWQERGTVCLFHSHGDLYQVLDDREKETGGVQQVPRRLAGWMSDHHRVPLEAELAWIREARRRVVRGECDAELEQMRTQTQLGHGSRGGSH